YYQQEDSSSSLVFRCLSIFFFSSRRRHTRSYGDWSSDVCSSDLGVAAVELAADSVEPRRRRPVVRVRGSEQGDAVEVVVRVVHRSEERRVGKEGRVWCGSVVKNGY